MDVLRCGETVEQAANYYKTTQMQVTSYAKEKEKWEQLLSNISPGRLRAKRLRRLR